MNITAKQSPAGASALALAVSSILFAATAGAQSAAQPSAAELETRSSLGEITVSASRIQRQDAFDAPTPVSVIGAEAINREARVDVADLIRQMPAFGSSSSPSNGRNQSLVTGGVAGLNLVNLRNLGFNRTLILFDGQRVATSNITGGVDISTIPTSLVERVEIVTGGASAAWGSDAIAGVVNILINKRFRGFETNVTYSDNFSNNHKSSKVEASFGMDFAGGRGSLILNAAATDTPDEFYSYNIPGFAYQRLVENPAYAAGNGQPRLIHAENVGLLRATPGGIITSGPLAGIHFVGSQATPEQFVGTPSRGFYAWGGTPNTSEGDIGLVSAPSNGHTLFGLATWDLTENISVSLQANRGKYWSRTNSWSDVRYGNVPISIENPYIPQSIVARMVDLGITSFNLGTTMHVPGRPSLQEQIDGTGYSVVDNTRELSRYVLSFEGNIGDNWSWNAYYQYGQNDLLNLSKNNQVAARRNLAVDAVRVTAANVGSSGLTIGSIACRSTLTNPTNGCQPLNVFGVGNQSPAANQYIGEITRNGGQFGKGNITQKVAAVSMQGTLPFGLPAGDVATAFGLETRDEEGVQVASPGAQASIFQLGNPKNFYGTYDTKEAFVEFNVPLLRDQGVNSLAFDVAGRLTDYSTSGKVETYKLGLVSQIVDSFRIRASYSLDIRAPTLFDLFNTGQPVTGTARDPNTGFSVAVFGTTRGNPDLKPEESTTQSLGFVYTPSWLDGFSVSLDWYDIEIDGAISSYNTTVTVDQCAAGNQLFCANLVFGGPNGALSEVFSQPVNADVAGTSGFDLVMDYRTLVGPGALNFNLMGNYMDEQYIESLGARYDYAGAIGRDSRYQGAPKLTGQASVTYIQGGWTMSAVGRVIGGTELVYQWGPADVDNNKVPDQYYLDLRASYKFESGLLDGVQVYAALDNVLDRKPPLVPMNTGGSAFETPYADWFHTPFGTVYRLGARWRL
jgi:iron complex outermembrane recepter protein